MNMKRSVLYKTLGMVLLAAGLSTISSCEKGNTKSAESMGTHSMSTAVAGENKSGEALSGEELYTRYCQVCHSMRPPAKSAPPIVGLASRFRKVYGNKDDAVAAMVSFMKAPDAANTSLGPEAIERFGLMPAMSMSEDELAKVSRWLWDQYDPDFKPRGGCR